MVRYEVTKVGIPRFEPIARAVELGLQEEAKAIQAEAGKFFMTWEGKPDVSTKVERTGDSIVATVYLTGDARILDIAKWVIHGTKQHDIPKSPKPWQMKYPGTFTPKTQPGVVQSVSGGKSGEATYHGKQVTHPGIKPRRIFEKIAQDRRRHFRLRMAKSMAKGLANAIRTAVKR